MDQQEPFHTYLITNEPLQEIFPSVINNLIQEYLYITPRHYSTTELLNNLTKTSTLQEITHTISELMKLGHTEKIVNSLKGSFDMHTDLILKKVNNFTDFVKEVIIIFNHYFKYGFKDNKSIYYFSIEIIQGSKSFYYRRMRLGGDTINVIHCDLKIDKIEIRIMEHNLINEFITLLDYIWNDPEKIYIYDESFPKIIIINPESKNITV